MIALSVLQRGTTDEKLRLLFDAFDTDSNGALDRGEVYQIYKASLAYGSEGAGASALDKLVDECFKLADTNNDGMLSFDEFKTAVQSQALVLDSLVHVPNIHV